MKTLSALFFLFLLLADPLAAQKQGIRGQVFFIDGNQLPDPSKASNPGAGIRREIEVYEPTYLADVQEVNGYFTSLTTKMIMTAASDRTGAFKIYLPPGNYSVFVKEPGGLYANLFDQQNQINPVVVKARKFTWVTITVDSEANH